MPVNVVKTPADEHKWSKAKSLAAKEGHTKDYAYVMGIFKNMKGGDLGEDIYKEMVGDLVSNLLEMTSTGSVATIPTPMGGARGDNSDSKNVSTLGNNEMAAANAATSAPVSDGKIAAQEYMSVGIPTNKIRPKKYVGEEKEDIRNVLSLLLNSSDEDMENPLKKNKPTKLGSKLNT